MASRVIRLLYSISEESAIAALRPLLQWTSLANLRGCYRYTSQWSPDICLVMLPTVAGLCWAARADVDSMGRCVGKRWPIDQFRTSLAWIRYICQLKSSLCSDYVDVFGSTLFNHVWARGFIRICESTPRLSEDDHSQVSGTSKTFPQVPAPIGRYNMFVLISACCLSVKHGVVNPETYRETGCFRLNMGLRLFSR